MRQRDARAVMETQQWRSVLSREAAEKGAKPPSVVLSLASCRRAAASLLEKKSCWSRRKGTRLLFQVWGGVLVGNATLFAIHVPPELPDIMKQFTKAAIRTQPHDVLQWSYGYFYALSRGEPLPVKDRVEMPVATQKNDTGLTPGLLKILHKQLSEKKNVELQDLQKKWKNLCLPMEQLRNILRLDNFVDGVEWMKFFALGCSALGGSLLSSMKHACEILTNDPEGGAARIPYDTFEFLYSYLASLDDEITEEVTKSFLKALKDQVARKEYMIGTADFTTIKVKP
ncbi:ropporin-1-like protein isoform 1-T1 [Liasis olivaceus]